MNKQTKLILFLSLPIALFAGYLLLSRHDGSSAAANTGTTSTTITTIFTPPPIELTNPVATPAIPMEVYKDFLKTAKSSNDAGQVASFYSQEFRGKLSQSMSTDMSSWLTSVRKAHDIIDIQYQVHVYQDSNSKALLKFTAKTTDTLRGRPLLGVVAFALEDNAWKITNEEFYSLENDAAPPSYNDPEH